MKKVYFLAIILFILSQATKAQTASQYFYKKATAQLENMTGAEIVVGTLEDDRITDSIKLPFTFSFGGSSYHSLTINTNGLVGLGPVPVLAWYQNDYTDKTLIPSATYPVLMVWGDDLYTATDGYVAYKVVTQADGTRKVVIEWKTSTFSDDPNDLTNKKIQLWLFEGSNKVQYVYGEGISAPNYNAAVGIASTTNDYITVNTADHTPSTTYNNNNTEWPGNGTSYVFSPTAFTGYDPIVLGGNTVINVKCNAGKTGSASLNSITGGSGQYIITWSGPNNYSSTGTSISGLGAGVYSYNITDDVNSSSLTGNITIAEPAALNASITPGGSVNICQGNTVSLTASSATSYLWSTGATTPGISTAAAGNYSVTITDANGCKATSPVTTTTVVTAQPAAITAGTDRGILCAGLRLTASPAGASNKYAWSNGSTAAVISLTNADADAVYTVKVTDANGCSNTASYTFNKQNLLGSYTVVGLTSISLATGTTVAKGSIGVTAAAGTISLGKSSSVAATGAVVKAKSITLTTPVNAPSLVYAPATLTLPTMQNNVGGTASSYPTYTYTGTGTLAGNYKTLTVKAGSNVTLDGTIFGTLTVEQGATVTFSKTAVDIDKLAVGKSGAAITAALTTLNFPTNSSIRISTSIVVYGRSRINPTNNDVTFYCGDAATDAETFTVSGLDVKVSGTVYIPVGTLSVTGTDATASTTNMNGLFIAQKVTSTGAKVIWDAACSPAAPAIQPQFVQAGVMQNVLENGKLSVKVLANPATTSFALNIRGSQAPVSIVVADINGRLLEKVPATTNSTISVGAKLASGVYFAQVMQGSESVTLKLIKN